MQGYIIEKYVSHNGRAPFDEWFKNLDEIFQARIDACLDRLSLGNFGNCKSLGGGIYEMRLFFGSGYRIYFGHTNNNIILILSAGSKKTQKKDIKKAKIIWSKYIKENKVK